MAVAGDSGIPAAATMLAFNTSIVMINPAPKRWYDAHHPCRFRHLKYHLYTPTLHRATKEKGHCTSLRWRRSTISPTAVSLMPRRARTRNKTHTLPTLLSAACARLASIWKEMTTALYKSC